MTGLSPPFPDQFEASKEVTVPETREVVVSRNVEVVVMVGDMGQCGSTLDQFVKDGMRC